MDNNQRQQRRRERRQQISSLQIVFVSILAIGMLLAINFSARIRRGQQIEDLREQIQATIDVEVDINESLRRELDYVSSDDYVQQWAHREGKMVRLGEKLVIPVPGEAIATPTPARPPDLIDDSPSTQEEDEENWKLWWQLFFDGDPPEWLE
jgi:hypothetical protein